MNCPCSEEGSFPVPYTLALIFTYFCWKKKRVWNTSGWSTSRSSLPFLLQCSRDSRTCACTTWTEQEQLKHVLNGSDGRSMCCAFLSDHKEIPGEKEKWRKYVWCFHAQCVYFLISFSSKTSWITRSIVDFSNLQWILPYVLSQLLFLILHRSLVPTTFVVISFLGCCPFAEFHLFLIVLNLPSFDAQYVFNQEESDESWSLLHSLHTSSSFVDLLLITSNSFSTLKTYRLFSCFSYKSLIPYIFYIPFEMRGLELHIVFKL